MQTPHELDLHNNFDFLGFDYSVEHRTLLLRWRRSPGEWVASGTPASVTIEFREVSEFRFQPRDSEKPFTEEDCVSSFGYWTDEDWANGVIVVEAAGDGEVIFDGGGTTHTLFNVMAADHHIFEDITFQNADIVFQAGLREVAGPNGAKNNQERLGNSGRVSNPQT